ncbi:MAG: RDD family protein [Thermodesulfobacteriota bacterium]
MQSADHDFSEQPRDLVPVAKFTSRAIAFVLDIIILLMILGLFHLLTLTLSTTMVHEDYSDRLTLVLLTYFLTVFTTFVIIPAYFFVFHALDGVTPGKLIMGIRVVNLENKTIKLGVSFLRVIGYILSGFPMAAGFLWILMDQNKKAWHDKLAGTKVIYT